MLISQEFWKLKSCKCKPHWYDVQGSDESGNSLDGLLGDRAKVREGQRNCTSGPGDFFRSLSRRLSGFRLGILPP